MKTPVKLHARQTKTAPHACSELRVSFKTRLSEHFLKSFLSIDANMFIKGLDQFMDVVEREQCVFNVEVKDPGAPVDFYINGKKVSKSDSRCEYVNLGEGKHQLIMHHIKMEDMGTVEAKTPSNRGDQMLTSSTAFDVTKGEEAPEIGETGPVTGVAYKECNWKVPYKVSDNYKYHQRWLYLQ